MSTPKFGNEMELFVRLFKTAANNGADEKFWKILASNDGKILTEFIDQVSIRFGTKVSFSLGHFGQEKRQGEVHFVRLSCERIYHDDARKRLLKLGSPLLPEELIELFQVWKHEWWKIEDQGIDYPIVPAGALSPHSIISRNEDGNPFICTSTNHDHPHGFWWPPGSRFAVFVEDKK